MSNPAGLVSAVTYRDPKAALAWLEAAFGFELTYLIEGEDASVAHAEMSHGASRLMVGGEWSPAHASPASMGGKVTQTVHIYIDSDVDAHCPRPPSVERWFILASGDSAGPVDVRGCSPRRWPAP